MMTEAEKQAKALRLIEREYLTATNAYERFHSMHEGYAVLLEEMKELEEEVFKKQEIRNLTRAMREAIQVGAMAIRFIVDLCPDLEWVREERE